MSERRVSESANDVADDGAFCLVVYDDGLTGIADSFEDGGQVAGVGGGEVADGFDVGDEGEAVDDEDVGLGEGIGGQGGGALGGKDEAEVVVAAFAGPAFDGFGGKGGGAGEIVGFVNYQNEWRMAGNLRLLSGWRGLRGSSRLRLGEEAGD